MLRNDDVDQWMKNPREGQYGIANYLRYRGANALLLAGYSDRDIQKIWRRRGENFK